jgi:O-antigen/teichoic acid export membrane protein
VIRDIDPAHVGTRATRGVAFMVLRYVGIRILSLGANIILSRILSPEAFGIYAITLFVLVMFSFISDFGLGPSLLQQRRAVSDGDLKTLFTAQQGMSVVLLLGVLAVAPGLSSIYHFGPDGVWYLVVMAVAGILASLRTAPTVVLERQLLYGKLALVEVAEVALFQVTAVALAVLHFGLWSFLAAVLLAKAVSTVFAFVLSGWLPGLGFDRTRFTELVRFALPFQLSWLTYLLRDYLVPTLAGLFVGVAAVGYLNWALALAAVPGQFAQIVARVSLPAFSRLQAAPDALAAAIVKVVRGLFLVAFPLQLTMVALAPWLIHLVFSDKWMPALVVFYLLSVHWGGANLTSPLMTALNAMGHPRTALALSAVWAAATITLSLLLIAPLGYLGVALAYAVTMVGAATAVTLTLRRHLTIHLWPAVRVPVVAAVLACGACFGVRQWLTPTLVNLGLLAVGTFLLYGALLWLAEGGRLRSEAEALFGHPGVSD